MTEYEQELYAMIEEMPIERLRAWVKEFKPDVQCEANALDRAYARIELAKARERQKE